MKNWINEYYNIRNVEKHQALCEILEIALGKENTNQNIKLDVSLPPEIIIQLTKKAKMLKISPAVLGSNIITDHFNKFAKAL